MLRTPPLSVCNLPQDLLPAPPPIGHLDRPMSVLLYTTMVLTPITTTVLSISAVQDWLLNIWIIRCRITCYNFRNAENQCKMLSST